MSEYSKKSEDATSVTGVSDPDTHMVDVDKNRPSPLCVMYKETKFHDLCLVCSDGHEISTVRVVLAACSSMWETYLLNASFSEAKKEKINVHFPGVVMESVIKYAFLYESDLCDGNPKLNDHSWDPNGFDVLYLYDCLNLLAAADYFRMFALMEEITTTIEDYMLTYPLSSLAVFDCCRGLHYTINDAKTLADFSREYINEWIGYFGYETSKREEKGKIDHCHTEAIAHLQPETIRGILMDKNHHCEEIILFNLLKEWTDASDTTSRTVFAKELISLIHLERIHPHMLRESVEPSGFATETQLKDAYFSRAEMGIIPPEFSYRRPFTTVFKEDLAEAIKVTGTGCCDGVYYRLRGKKIYEMQSKQGYGSVGFPCTYSLKMHRSPTHCWSWHLMIKANEINPAGSDEVVFYRQTYSPSIDYCPKPKKKWEVGAGGNREGMPELSYRYC